MKTKPKYNPEIYLKAARDIDSGLEEFSCCAICKEGNRDKDIFGYQHRLIYAEHFDVSLRTFSFLWGSYYSDIPNNTEIKELRVLALCLMAQICKDIPYEN